jgi:hypothetical protein
MLNLSDPATPSRPRRELKLTRACRFTGNLASCLRPGCCAISDMPAPESFKRSSPAGHAPGADSSDIQSGEPAVSWRKMPESNARVLGEYLPHSGTSVGTHPAGRVRPPGHRAKLPSLSVVPLSAPGRAPSFWDSEAGGLGNPGRRRDRHWLQLRRVLRRGWGWQLPSRLEFPCAACRAGRSLSGKPPRRLGPAAPRGTQCQCSLCRLAGTRVRGGRRAWPTPWAPAGPGELESLLADAQVEFIGLLRSRWQFLSL